MSSIAEVIGWKHNHQEGMCCKENSDGVMEIREFPGGIPSQSLQDTWTAEYEAGAALRRWEVEMAESDALIPRWAEDLYDGLALEIRDGISAVTKNKIVQKKAKRELRPS
jgi:hypothetical protein